MIASSNFKALGFTEAVMQTNFSVTHDLAHANRISSIWYFCAYIWQAQAFHCVATVSLTLWKWRYNIFELSRDQVVDVSRELVSGVSSSKVTKILSLGYLGLVKVDISDFLFITWPQYRGTMCLCGWGPLTLSHHLAKFEVHKPYGTWNNDVSNISSSSNSNAEVPMPWFANGHSLFLVT